MGIRITVKYFLWFGIFIFSAAILLPLLYLVFGALYNGGEFSIASFLSIFEREVLESIVNSIIISLLVGVLSVGIGSVFAFLIGKTNLPFKNILQLFLILPLLLPPYITTVAWTDVWLYIGFSKAFIYSLPAVIFILTTIYIPLATFIIAGSLQSITASIEEAGEIITDYKTVFLKIVLPLIRPALFSSFILIFILSMAEFAVPSYLTVHVFTTEIFIEFTAFYNYSSAIMHALVLTAICFILIFPEKYYLAQVPFISFGKKSFSIKTIKLNNNVVFVSITVIYLFLFVLLPIIMLFMQVFGGNGQSFIYAIQQLIPAFKDTLLLAVGSALLITVFGFVFALLKNRFINYLLLFVFAVPAIVTGMALTKFYNTPFLNLIYSSSLIVLIALISRYVFISEKIMSHSLQQIPKSYSDAAVTMGATPFQTFKKIILPLMGEALFISFFIVIIFSIGELTAVIMVYPPGTSLLSVRIFTLMANASQDVVSAMSLVALLFTFLIIVLMFGIKKIVFNQEWKKVQS